eukprot:CAMPEP_0194032904 /NCGR_PEP_ID=MMETSP0009_2-20130614/5749_1 /TAXON_ID=210454 /ORGANISM="Grammatophora oceanica, Strain CCMP 410" /LENGTH=207 /DNA_ID=CAMNT_0038673481 /DNA_START=85 /DNA_END=708 /DNA_ORIENTATION=-
MTAMAAEQAQVTAGAKRQLTRDEKITNDTDDVSNFADDFQRLDSAADAIMDSIRAELFAPPSETTSQPDAESSDGVLTADNHLHDEDEMGDEIMRLGNVIADLKQDLDNQSVTSMTSALSNLDDTPVRYRYKPSALSMGAEEAEKFIRKNKLYGPGVGGDKPNTPLIAFTVVVWSFLLVLLYHVRFGDVDEEGFLAGLPEVLQHLLR